MAELNESQARSFPQKIRWDQMEEGGYYMITVQAGPTTRFTAKGVVKKGIRHITMVDPELITQTDRGVDVTNPNMTVILQQEDILRITTVPMIGKNVGPLIRNFVSGTKNSRLKNRGTKRSRNHNRKNSP